MPRADFETLLYATAGSVATITLNRPDQLNTIVPPMPDEIEATQPLGGILGGLIRNAPEALGFIETAANKGVRVAVEGRDGPFGDYSQAPPE